MRTAVAVRPMSQRGRCGCDTCSSVAFGSTWRFRKHVHDWGKVLQLSFKKNVHMLSICFVSLKMSTLPSLLTRSRLPRIVVPSVRRSVSLRPRSVRPRHRNSLPRRLSQRSVFFHLTPGRPCVSSFTANNCLGVHHLVPRTTQQTRREGD